MSLATNYYTFLFIIVLPQVKSVFFLYGKQLNINKSESYILHFENLEIKQSDTARYWRPPSGQNMSFYRNLSKNHTADERCQTGLPLSMAIYQLSPYVSDTFIALPKTVVRNGTKVTLPGQFEYMFQFFGVFPAILKKAIPTCCHNRSDVRFGKILFEQYVPGEVDPADEYDFSFPLYGESMDDTMYRSNSFIPIVQAPSVALLVLSEGDESGKTHFIATTIFKAWPMFLFILLLASCAGIVMWCFDRSKNEEQFPKPFVEGAWEGFWWAFTTMTTVGYGDRTPKSFLARFFCILWIIFGILIICILSGIITAALSASTKIHFNIHGAKIGAVASSKEFIFGLSLNAEMHEFSTSSLAFAELQYHKRISGILIDSYVASSFGEELITNNVRVDRMMDHAITYGIRMAKGSEKLEKCLKRYIRDHPQDIFDMFSKSLTTVKNPKDRENLQQKEAEKLFYQDETMNKMLVYGAYFIASLLVFGLCTQFIAYFVKKRQASRSAQITTQLVCDKKRGFGSFQEVDRPVRSLLNEYKCFQAGWMQKMKAIHDE